MPDKYRKFTFFILDKIHTVVSNQLLNDVPHSKFESGQTGAVLCFKFNGGKFKKPRTFSPTDVNYRKFVENCIIIYESTVHQPLFSDLKKYITRARLKQTGKLQQMGICSEFP